MRITLAYNLKTENVEDQAELHTQAEIDELVAALKELRHEISPVEVSGKPSAVIERLLDSEPDLIFNIAEGRVGSAREAFYPGIYEQLRIPYTGSPPSVLHVNLDKQLAKMVVSAGGVRIPRGALVTPGEKELPAELTFPLIVKPNYEGSSIGIHQTSIVETLEEYEAMIGRLVEEFPSGLVVEEFIRGRELTVPLLQAYPGEVLEVIEITFDLEKRGAKYNIYDYTFKYGGGANLVSVDCPAGLTEDERRAVVSLARRAANVMHYADYARVDIRLDESGEPYFIEMNPLPSLEADVAHMIAAKKLGMSLPDVLKLIIRSASRRYGITARKRTPVVPAPEKTPLPRPTAREAGIHIGYHQPGHFNSITDVKGVKVGHVSYSEDDVEIPGVPGKTCVRTGVTAILPGGGDAYNRHIVAGGFVLNGIGEMAGLTQVREWGWIETPILLTNTASVGTIYRGLIDHMMKKHPEINENKELVIPVVGETDDSFLNDVRVEKVTASDAGRAIKAAKGGVVEQGSVGAGTGMTSFDLAGGIGTSSRVLGEKEGGYTIGVLVLSNFGKMRNLTIGGAVVGRELDTLYPKEGRRSYSYGSVIVVVATDAPLLPNQLTRISKRAALGLGRVGSTASSWSGEIIIAFSTSNRVARSERGRRHLTMRFISDRRIDPLYEAVIEATEEAVLNALFCSGGMKGRDGHASPPLPHDRVLKILRASRG